VIHVFIGTKAQLIKMAPVMVELQRRGLPWNFVFSGQHQATVDNIRDDFGLRPPDVTLYQGRDITGIGQMLLWSLRVVLYCLRHRDRVWQGDREGIVLNHGDTFSTLLGSLLARLAGLRCAHVESGLRSFRLLHPFPEEITRRLTFRLCDIYFAPGQWALDNLRDHRGIKVDTVYNTLLDSLRLSTGAAAGAVAIPGERFALVSLHRFENIFSRRRLRHILHILQAVAREIPLLSILHPPTEKQLRRSGFYHTLAATPGIELRPRYGYFQFVELLRAAELAITDGGSNQEECFYLGKPCIIMRSATERQEGVGRNAVISNYDLEKVLDVVRDPARYRLEPVGLDQSPARLIVDTLQDRLHQPATRQDRYNST